MAEYALSNILKRTHLLLNANQRRRLAWIIARKGIPAIWKKGWRLLEQTECVLLLDAPSNIELEQLQQALTAGAIALVAYSEDPLFDALKAAFFDLGTVGAVGADGPHQLWWGGRSYNGFESHVSLREMPLIVTCYAPTLINSHKARRLTLSADMLNLSHAIAPHDAMISWELSAAAKVEYIWNLWSSTDRPVLWVDPNAVLHGYPSLPVTMNCDFAVHRYEDRCLESSTLYFGRSSKIKTLLDTWHKLCVNCPGGSDSYLLDQAWSLMTSQTDIDTVWLPRSYCAKNEALAPGEQPIILHEPNPAPLMTSYGELLPPIAVESHSMMARNYARTGAPEAQLVMRSAAADTHGSVIVIIHDTSHPRQTLCADVFEQIAEAFFYDAGGFSQMEVILCRCENEVQACINVALDSWVLMTNPHERFSKTTFRTFGDVINASSRNETANHAGHVSFLAGQKVTSGGKLKNVKSSSTFLARATALRNSSASPSVEYGQL